VIFLFHGKRSFEGVITYAVSSPHEGLKFIRCTVKDSNVFVDRWDSGRSSHSDAVYLDYATRRLVLVHSVYLEPIALLDTLVWDTTTPMTYDLVPDPAPTGRTASINGYDAQEFAGQRGTYREVVWASTKPAEYIRQTVAHLFDDNPACGNTGVF